jgi:hypothetical protein
MDAEGSARVMDQITPSPGVGDDLWLALQPRGGHGIIAMLFLRIPPLNCISENGDPKLEGEIG